jgi:hypothetical protein
MSERSPKGLLALILALAALSAPSAAATPLAERDHSHEILRLQSRQTVRTWEEDGVRVFLIADGAVVRQGDFRIAAPRMVIWFDREASARPDVMAAQVRVYAEGIAGDKEHRAETVRIVEDGVARQAGAIWVHLTSIVSFMWDCPLERLDGPIESPLLARALEMTEELPGEAVWPETPPMTDEEKITAIDELFESEQTSVFYDMEEGLITVVEVGDVRGTYGNLDIRADEAVVWFSTAEGEEGLEIYAHGNVRVSRSQEAEEKGLRLTGWRDLMSDTVEYLGADELYLNPGRSRSLSTHSEVRLRDPRQPGSPLYVVRGDESYQVDSKTLVIREASFTTSEFAHPPYQFKSERAQITVQEDSVLVTAWENRFAVGKGETTLMWLPFVGTDLTARSYLLSEYAIGVSDKFGFFVQSTWQPLDLTTQPEWVDEWTVNLDWYTARGPAIGTTFAYDVPGDPYPTHKGEVTAYYVYDSGDEDGTGLDVPQTSRGRLHAEHRTQINPAWRLDAELYWLSDSGFLQEYFQGDFENEKPPESYLLGRYLKDSTYLALLFKARINDFLTQVEETPSADLEIMGLPLGPLVYDGRAVTGIYDLEFNDELVPAPPDPPRLFRFHTDHMVALPFNAGPVRINPFVRALATYVTDSALPGGGFGGSESQTGFGAGISVSTTFTRIFDTVNDTFNLNRLRHIIIPYVRAEGLGVSGADSADFIQMDDIDTIDNWVRVVLGLRQVLQTKREIAGEWQSVDWAELDMAFVGQSSDSVVTSRDDSFFMWDFDMLLTDNITIRSNDNRVGGDTSVVNVGATFDYLPKAAVNLDYDYVTDRSSTITAGLEYELSDRYLLLLYEQYELGTDSGVDDESLQTTVVIRRLLHHWILDLGISIGTGSSDSSLIFGFGPEGWGVFGDPSRAGRR